MSTSVCVSVCLCTSHMHADDQLFHWYRGSNTVSTFEDMKMYRMICEVSVGKLTVSKFRMSYELYVTVLMLNSFSLVC